MDDNGDSALPNAAVLNQALVADVERMLGDGTIEGLVRRLRRDFSSLALEADAAVGHGVEKLIVLRAAPDNPSRYLAASAYNEMKRLARQRARHQSLDALAVDDHDDGPGWEPRESGWTVEERALLTGTYEQLRAHVQSWDTENIRVVTLLYLEAAFLGDPLPSRDAASVASDLLGYEVEDGFVRTWKSRGFKRLREYVTDLDRVD